jgi:uncharacterized protein (DUF1697 family)
MPLTYVGLLRGINVGGKNMIPMTDLVSMFAEAGCMDVRTYIQSGNVIFRAAPEECSRLPGRITAAIAKRFGYSVPLVLRTTEELASVISNNPFLRVGAAEDELHVVFLADLPAAGCVAALDPNRSPPDAFVVSGREVYLRLPNGAARTRLTNAYFDSKLATTSTGRNWRTVIKLLGLATH